MSKKFGHFEQVLVRDSEDDIWKCDFYNRYRSEVDTSYRHSCISDGNYKFCIPYEGNEYLAGTTNSPDVLEKLKFGDKIMVTDNGTDWRKATFVDYDHDSNEYCYKVCIPNCICCFKYCRKGWLEEDE